MPLRIQSPTNSFIQFQESNEILSCEFKPLQLCLPVFQASDVAWQFFVIADSEVEADALCDLENDLVEIGITDFCDNSLLVTFPWKTERFRISPTTVLYNCTGGLTDFDSVIEIGECFLIKVIIQGIYETLEGCSNCLQRIGGICHTSVIEFGNEDNAFGFSYCAGANQSIDEVADCEPTLIQFTNQATMSIPYTAGLQAKYGIAPTVTVWIYDYRGILIDAGLQVTLDAFPPTVINVDMGGLASGFIKIN